MSVLLFAATIASACVTPTEATGAREQHDAYAHCVLRMVHTASSNDDGTIDGLVAEDAAFSIGGGDVVVPLGSGNEGFLALVQRLDAERYEYPGWDYMDFPQDPCGEVSVELRFIAQGGESFSDLMFTFKNGKLAEAVGRTRSRNAGELREAFPHG